MPRNTPRRPAAGRSASDTIAVELANLQSVLRVDCHDLKRLVRGVLAGEGVTSASISITLVDDAAIRRINAARLGHDWPTDVISFPLSEPGESPLAGDLIVSAEMAAATASQVGADPLSELSLYVVHGLLHLRGYDDHRDEDARRMREREGQALEREGIANPFDLGDRSQPADRAEEPPPWSG